MDSLLTEPPDRGGLISGSTFGTYHPTKNSLIRQTEEQENADFVKALRYVGSLDLSLDSTLPEY